MANEKRLIDPHDLWTDIMMLPHNGDMISSEEVEQAIKDAPTVDAVPVVHGRWKRRIVDYAAPYSWKVECSNCDFDICGLGDAYLFKYCPNCGAKMDGGNEDG